MNQNDRVTNDPNSDDDAGRSVSLPARNPPPGDPGTNPKRGDDIKPGQPEVAGNNNNEDNTSTNQGGSAIEDPADDSRNDGDRR